MGLSSSAEPGIVGTAESVVAAELEDPAKRATIISEIQGALKSKPVWARRLGGALLIIGGGLIAVVGPFDGSDQAIGVALAAAGVIDLTT